MYLSNDIKVFTNILAVGFKNICVVIHLLLNLSNDAATDRRTYK